MPSSSRRRSRGATLPELLIAVAILLVLMMAVVQFCSAVELAWSRAATDPFAEAQNAFETVTRGLASATLEQYQDYADSNGAFRIDSTFVPDHVARRSDLDFVCGPSASLMTASKRTTAGSAAFFLTPRGLTQTYFGDGMGRMLNACGYFVDFGDDDTAPGFVLLQSHTWRWRLRQAVQPAESLHIFATTNSADWIGQMVPAGTAFPVLADNIIALIILPEKIVAHAPAPLAGSLGYDSRDPANKLTLHQLPPMLRVALVAIDEGSALRLAQANGTNPPQLVGAGLFQSAAKVDADLAALDASLTAGNIRHRILQRDILLPSADWSATASQ